MLYCGVLLESFFSDNICDLWYFVACVKTTQFVCLKITHSVCI